MAGEAHGKQGEAVLADVVHGLCFVLLVLVGGRLKIEPSKTFIGAVCDDGFDIAKHIFVLFIELFGHQQRGGEDVVLGGGDDGVGHGWLLGGLLWLWVGLDAQGNGDVMSPAVVAFDLAV